MKKIRSNRDNSNAGVVFCLPIILGLLIFFIPVVFRGIGFAFSNVNLAFGLETQFTGLENFKYALRVDPNYLTTLLSDIGTLLTNLPIIVVFSLFVAVLLNSGVPGKTVFRAIFFLPVIVCTGMIAAIDGNNTLLSTFLSSSEVTDSASLTAMSDISRILQGMNFSPTLIEIVSGAANNIFDIVNRSGVQILICLAGIQSISPSIYESASVEGASSWEMFWKITLPMISPMILVCVLYTFVESITRDDTELVAFIEGVAFNKSEFGYSAAMAWFHYLVLISVLGILLLFIWLIAKASKRKEYN